MRILLASLLILAAAVLPAEALEVYGEHRLLATYDLDPEFRAAELLVIRRGDSWVEIVVTQRISPAWPARFEGELSFWREVGNWDVGGGVLWRVTERRAAPWVMVARPW